MTPKVSVVLDIKDVKAFQAAFAKLSESMKHLQVTSQSMAIHIAPPLDPEDIDD